MVTRSAAREASETWHIRLRLASHASSVMAINLACARVNNNGRRANGVGEKKTLKAKSWKPLVIGRRFETRADQAK